MHYLCTYIPYTKLYEVGFAPTTFKSNRFTSIQFSSVHSPTSRRYGKYLDSEEKHTRESIISILFFVKLVQYFSRTYIERLSDLNATENPRHDHIRALICDITTFDFELMFGDGRRSDLNATENTRYMVLYGINPCSRRRKIRPMVCKQKNACLLRGSPRFSRFVFCCRPGPLEHRIFHQILTDQSNFHSEAF